MNGRTVQLNSLKKTNRNGRLGLKGPQKLLFSSANLHFRNEPNRSFVGPHHSIKSPKGCGRMTETKFLCNFLQSWSNKTSKLFLKLQKRFESFWVGWRILRALKQGGRLFFVEKRPLLLRNRSDYANKLVSTEWERTNPLVIDIDDKAVVP